MNKIKLIASDMDGTLLDSRKILSPNFRKVYRLLRENGVFFAIASGRQYHALTEKFSDFEHDIIFIAENGGFIEINGEITLLNPFKSTDAGEILTAIRSLERSDIVFCGKNGAYIESHDPEFLEDMDRYYSNVHHVDDLMTVEDDLLKISICNRKDLVDYTFPEIDRIRGSFTLTVSSSIWMDMMPPDINKGNAVKFVQKKFGIEPEETMVFGDYLNDYEMMQSAYYSYAMANSHPDLLGAARFRAKSNDEDGVVSEIMERFQFA